MKQIEQSIYLGLLDLNIDVEGLGHILLFLVMIAT
jgi:hypothetical protein